MPWNASFAVKQGQELALGQVDTSTGIRGYLAVAGGIDVPLYLGSRSTFPNGNFGGYQGRCDTMSSESSMHLWCVYGCIDYCMCVR